MKTSTLLGRTLGVLLIFSAISYAQTLIQKQEVRPAVEPPPVLEVAGQIPEAPTPDADQAGDKAEPIVALGTYTATAYSLSGRTASGKPVSRGLIAADPRVLPLGTRVRVEAG